jgi:EAL domain-containing protein (putative c-di-GMP-specific phosphodiesterase class I)
MSVTMEGVETVEQLELITREGNFDEAQGWLFSPAVSAAEIEAMLDPVSLRKLLPEPSRRVA